MMRKAMRNVFVVGTAIILLGSLMIDVASAQEDRFPTKSIKLLLSGSPGSSADLPLRALAKAAEKSLGQQIICSNVPGASGIRALGTIVKEKPDGYTLGLMTTAAIATAVVEKIEFSLVKDFAPIMQVQGHPLPFAVKKDAPWNTWQEFVKWARENKDKATIGSWGTTSTGTVALAQIEKLEKVKFVYVPFPGAGEVMAALLGGHIVANNMTSAIVYAKSGEVKVLLFFSDERLTTFPGVPTAKELYGDSAGFSGGSTGLVTPKGLPEPILRRLHDAFRKAMGDPEFMKIVEKFDLVPSYRDPREFAQFIEMTDKGMRDYVK
jgi:tripartite-type tricarboxylate transporter receptor subunit TctC